ncbi:MULTISPECIES: hypothetical protein [Methylocaldum]|jgi:hypothetical protein|uniref:hypothetical protein n=1 Tax=unclassified Methylocaldum TaxID=2622260 RepID=UPI00098B74B0|nr:MULTISPECIES: hypothetical protein [unclassified Methylocaldum]MBP1148242.1 hypothetical protein [Methylocaldum sp. RMAD-M]MVF24924.1 hypothetical protein [Methylocaldum sp. BRCS4]
MKSYALAAVLSSVMVAGPALADNDFRALGQVSNLTPMTETQLAAVEGGQSCSGLLSFANTCLNVAVPTITAYNVSFLGLLGATTQSIKQVTNQYIQ